MRISCGSDCELRVASRGIRHFSLGFCSRVLLIHMNSNKRSCIFFFLLDFVFSVIICLERVRALFALMSCAVDRILQRSCSLSRDGAAIMLICPATAASLDKLSSVVQLVLGVVYVMGFFLVLWGFFVVHLFGFGLVFFFRRA